MNTDMVPPFPLAAPLCARRRGETKPARPRLAKHFLAPSGRRQPGRPQTADRSR
jgi:hypothetical protein